MILRAEKIGKIFVEKTVFEESTVSFETGQISCIVGANGAGKSTLIQCLAGVYRLSAGRVFLDDQHICPESTAYKTKIVISYQDTKLDASQLPIRSIYKWTRFFNRHLTKSMIIDLCNRFRISEDDRYKKIYKLSGGTKKKLELIKALLADVPFYIFDEPFANLDREMREIVKGVLFEYRKRNKGIILVTHDNSLVQMADKTYTIKNKRILEGIMSDELTIRVKNISDETINDLVEKKIVLSGDIQVDDAPDIDMSDISKRLGIPADKLQGAKVIRMEKGQSLDAIKEKIGFSGAVKTIKTEGGITFKKVKFQVNNKTTDLVNILNYFNDNGMEYKDIQM
jgi:ABC-type multidrug transport system ATPase subunit